MLSLNRSLTIRLFILALIIVVASLSGILAFQIAAHSETTDVFKEVVAGMSVMLVSSISTSFLSPLLATGLQRFYGRTSIWQNRVIVFEASALAGMVGGLISSGTYLALSKTLLLSSLDQADLFLLIPLASVAIAVFAAQIRNWLQEAGQIKDEAAREMGARAKELQQEAELREKFLFTLAHESRTPLTSLRVSAELLRDVGVKNEDPVIARLSQSIQRSAFEMASLSASITDLSSLLRQDFSLKPEMLSTIEVVHVASEAVNAAITAKKQKLKVTGAEAVPEIYADRQSINRILTCTLDNASKYSPPESQIDLMISSDGKAVTFEVKDRGEGIGAEDQKKIFKPFYRVKVADSQHGAGIGIGLTVSKTLVEAQGGSIWLTSAPGQGSSFFVKMPMIKDGHKPQEAGR